MAESSGLLHEGDELLEVNEQELRGKHIDDVHNILQNMQGSLTFLVVPIRQHHMSPVTYPGGPVSQNGTPTPTTTGRHGIVYLKVSQKFLFVILVNSRDMSIDLHSAME